MRIFLIVSHICNTSVNLTVTFVSGNAELVQKLGLRRLHKWWFQHYYCKLKHISVFHLSFSLFSKDAVLCFRTFYKKSSSPFSLSDIKQHSLDSPKLEKCCSEKNQPTFFANFYNKLFNFILVLAILLKEKSSIIFSLMERLFPELTMVYCWEECSPLERFLCIKLNYIEKNKQTLAIAHSLWGT